MWGKFSAEFDAKSDSNFRTRPARPEASKTPDAEEVAKGDADAELKASEKESILKKPEEVKQEVEALNLRVKDWAYALPSFRVENFSKLKKDLISKE